MCDKRPCDKGGCANNECESLAIGANKSGGETCNFSPCSTTCSPRGPESPKALAKCQPCAPPPDLKHIKPEDRTCYRQCELQKWLDNLVERQTKECFGHYIGRAFAVATRELNKNAVNRECMGDEFPHFLDRYCWRLWHGTKLNLQKHGVTLGNTKENYLLSILREEVLELYNARKIIPDPRQQMKSGETWTHEGSHCSSSRAGKDCYVRISHHAFLASVHSVFVGI